MATRFFGCLLAASLGFGTTAVAQRAASPGLVAAVAAPVSKPAGAPASAPTPLFRADSIFVNPDVRPQFVGGETALRDYLLKNIRYPEQALRQHVSGKVFVRFVLSTSGQVTDASVVRGPGSGLNEEALRLVWLMPAWQPARQRSQPVRVSCTIPINFAE